MGATFDFQCGTRVVAGQGAADRAGVLARELGASRVVIVADAEALAGGRVTSLSTTLEQLGIAVVGTVGVAAGESPQPEAGAPSPIDAVLVLGGNVAFRAAVLAAGSAPMIGLPTTASSGLGHARCAVLVVDPDLSVDVPDEEARAATIVAVGRTVEAWVTSARNPMSDLYAREAWRQLARSYVRVATGAADVEPIFARLLGGFLSDVAASRSGLGALDACTRPVAARGTIDQGSATAILLPQVVRWNTRVVADRYAELSAAGGEARRPEALIARLEDFVAAGGFPESLGQAGILERELPSLAERAAAEPSASANPRKFDVAGALELYAAAY